MAGILVLSFGIKWFLQGSNIEKWPTTTGIVITSGTKWQQTRGAETPTLIAEVTYQYEVHGMLLENDDISTNQFGSNNVEHARSEAAKYPPGSAVTVYYSPDDPARSYLEPTIGWLYLIAVVVGVIALIAGMFILRQGASTTSTQLSSLEKKDPLSGPTETATSPAKHRQSKMLVLAVTAGILGMTTFLFQNYSFKVNENNNSDTASHVSGKNAPAHREGDKSIVHILQLMTQEQRRYKSSTGSYTKNLQELTLPDSLQPKPAEQGSIIMAGYLFRIVPQNGTAQMNYQRDFVISATPLNYAATGLYSYAVGPKAIVIFADNQGKAVTNAVSLRYWKPYPKE